MKFTWGTGIFIVIILIFSGVIGFFIYSTTLDAHLVETNYYEKELAYQSRLEKIRNTAMLEKKVEVEYNGQVMELVFPDLGPGKKIEGTVWFYRPSDETMDFTIPVHLADSNRQVIDTRELHRGKWLIKLEWEADSVGYYQEETLVIRK